ncbi:uncharacterized protein LOC114580576 [Dendrobium catenatum]|uniref:uncharacterized protein LOC114580576 n=1 Tax=Dendrobium catenatum TaxID=906689 RepID=UPI00109F5470|nr:uncharacterized protein LOC114580576 [Dendrobium catenatum]
MDGLSTSFDLAVANKSFDGISADNCEVTHLMFADDLLVFGYATTANANTLNSILKDFASVTGLKKKLFTVSWKNTCTPKQNDGLGIPSIDYLYHNYACSIIWRFLNSNSLLFYWWRAKYYSLWNFTSANKAPYWDLLCKKASCIRNCISFSITPSSNLSVIWDPWCGGNSIADYLKASNSITNYSSYFSWKVSNIILRDNWNLPQFFESHISFIIKAVPISSLAENHFWVGKQNPVFVDLYKQFYCNWSKVPWYKYVWHKHHALRYSVYVWLAFKDGLKTSEFLAKRGINTAAKCCFCHDDTETISHLFFECSFTFAIAKYFLPWLNVLLMRPNLHQLYNSIFEQRSLAHSRNYHLLTSSAIIYFLWRARNDRIFGGYALKNLVYACRDEYVMKILGNLQILLDCQVAWMSIFERTMMIADSYQLPLGWSTWQPGALILFWPIRENDPYRQQRAI